MSLDVLGWGSIANFAKEVLDKIISNPAQKAQATLALAQLEQQGEFKAIDAQLEMMKAQTDVNLEEAKSSSLFVSGWRPAIGWICASALLYQYLLRPILPWALTLLGHPIDAPIALDGTLQELVTGMLGFGLLRTIDKGIPHFTK